MDGFTYMPQTMSPTKVVMVGEREYIHMSIPLILKLDPFNKLVAGSSQVVSSILIQGL